MKGDNRVMESLRRLLHKVEIDRPVFFGILTRLWGGIAGPITALLIAHRFSPECQGYYYTFSSLLAMQVFVELGLGTVIVQFASHEWSSLHLDDSGKVVGDAAAFSRLISLAKISSFWYAAGGVLIAAGLGLGGYLFFLHSQPSSVTWQLPWLALCFLTGVTVLLIPVWSILEGCNQVAALYGYRFLQGVVSALVVWLAILAGAGLWTGPCMLAATVICAAVFLGVKYRNFIKNIFLARPLHGRILWKSEILPMQWRVALSWVSGYFVFSFFTPVLFRYKGPIVAGQFGMTWSIIGAIGGVAGSWISPKTPQFGMLIAKKKYRELDRLFWRTTRIFIFIALSLSAMAWLLIFALYRSGNSLALRVLPPLPAGLFFASQAMYVLFVPFSFYLRAHKKEPLLWLAIISGILTGFSTFFFGRKYGVIGMAWSYLAVNILLLPFVGVIWHRCRAQWHQDAPGENADFLLLKEYFLRRISEKGFAYCAVKGFFRVFYSVAAQVAGILAFPLCWMLNIRFIYLSESAIGHLCVEPDCYVKEGILGGRSRRATVLLASVKRVTNRHLLEYWKEHLHVVRSPLLCGLLEPLARNRFTGYSTYHFAFSVKGAAYPRIQGRYKGPPLLFLTDDDRKFGASVLAKMGVPRSSWFVCVHCREGSRSSSVSQLSRNADIASYMPAMEAIVRKGGWVIRMGERGIKALAQMPRVIDYANSDYKSERMDVYLCASCRFFIGSGSGLYHVADVFGVPAAVTNFFQFAGILPYGPNDVSIPKLVWSERESRYLTFVEIFGSPVAEYFFDHMYEQAGLRSVDNTPEDIKDLVVEMLERTEGKAVYTPKDEELQAAFKALMRPRHNSYGAVSRVGRDFLRKYAFLLDDVSGKAVSKK